jgi:hypothetical protein
MICEFKDTHTHTQALILRNCLLDSRRRDLLQDLGTLRPRALVAYSIIFFLDVETTTSFLRNTSAAFKVNRFGTREQWLKCRRYSEENST